MDRPQLIKMLRLHEGERLSPYMCTAGKWTIGVGRNFEDSGFSEEEQWAIFNGYVSSFPEQLKRLQATPITQPIATMLLNNDVDNVIRRLDKTLPWWRNMSHLRQNVLIDMCFNMGLWKLMKFKETLQAMEKGDYRTAGREMLKSRWAYQVGLRAVRLSYMMQHDKEYT